MYLKINVICNFIVNLGSFKPRFNDHHKWPFHTPLLIIFYRTLKFPTINIIHNPKQYQIQYGVVFFKIDSKEQSFKTSSYIHKSYVIYSIFMRQTLSRIINLFLWRRPILILTFFIVLVGVKELVVN